MSMHTTRSDLDVLRGVLAAADEPLTAREILEALDAEGDTDFESAHQIATVLGRQAQHGDVTVISNRPYRYTLGQSS